MVCRSVWVCNSKQWSEKCDLWHDVSCYSTNDDMMMQATVWVCMYNQCRCKVKCRPTVNVSTSICVVQWIHSGVTNTLWWYVDAFMLWHVHLMMYILCLWCLHWKMMIYGNLDEHSLLYTMMCWWYDDACSLYDTCQNDNTWDDDVHSILMHSYILWWCKIWWTCMPWCDDALSC